MTRRMMTEEEDAAKLRCLIKQAEMRILDPEDSSDPHLQDAAFYSRLLALITENGSLRSDIVALELRLSDLYDAHHEDHERLENHVGQVCEQRDALADKNEQLREGFEGIAMSSTTLPLGMTDDEGRSIDIWKHRYFSLIEVAARYAVGNETP